MMRTDKPSDNGRLLALGQHLKQVREDQEYSVAEVAERLFLSSNQVLAIEDARYESLPAEVFVKGYLRAYAKLLDLEPEEIVAQYQPVQVAPAPGPVAASEVEKEPMHLLERMPDTSTTLVLGALAALVLLFLVSVIYFATSTGSLPEDAQPEAVQPEAVDEEARQQSLLDTDNLQGELPYKVVPGNSYAVRLRYPESLVPVVADTGKHSAQLLTGA